MITRILAVVILLVTVSLDTALAEEYRVGPGDKLEISVFNQDDLSGEYTVSGAGDISLPLIGSVRVANFTVTEVEQRIVDKLRPDYLKNPRVNIEVLNYRPFYILGEVKEPSSYPYVDGMTYMNAVAIAGGFTYRAKKDYAVVKRGNDPNADEIEVDMNDLVQPGDIIRIKERFF